MGEIIAVCMFLAEVLMLLQCLEISFEQKVRGDKYTIGLILIDLLVYTGIALKVLPTACTYIVHIVIFLYSYLEFKRSIPKTIIKTIFGFALGVSLEVIILCIMTIYDEKYGVDMVTTLSSLLALILAYIIKKSIILLEKQKVIKGKLIVIAICYVLGVGAVMNQYLDQGLREIYLVFILTIVVFVLFYLHRLELAQNEIEKKNHELEVQKIYGRAYEDLVTEVRRRQHDFKNQLGAIYSMHLVADSQEELTKMQRDYGDILLEQCKFDSILTSCMNTVLAGYLYYRCISCEKEGIDVEYHIHIGQAECSFAMHEIIEILGILIDNACEHLMMEPTEPKSIKLNFQENDETLMFSVSNPAKYMSSVEIEKMFIRGYSKKGENRGIGLARVLELVKKYKAEIKVANDTCGEENWINFTVNIVK